MPRVNSFADQVKWAMSHSEQYGQYEDMYKKAGLISGGVNLGLRFGMAIPKAGYGIGKRLLSPGPFKQYVMNVGMMGGLDAATSSDRHPDSNFIQRFGKSLVNPWVHGAAFGVSHVLPSVTKGIGTYALGGLQRANAQTIAGEVAGAAKPGFFSKAINNIRGGISNHVAITSPQASMAISAASEMHGVSGAYFKNMLHLNKVSPELRKKILADAVKINEIGVGKFSNVRKTLMADTKKSMIGLDKGSERFKELTGKLNGYKDAGIVRETLMDNKDIFRQTLTNAGMTAPEKLYGRGFGSEVLGLTSPNSMIAGGVGLTGAMGAIPVIGAPAQMYYDAWMPGEVEKTFNERIKPNFVNDRFDYGRIGGAIGSNFTSGAGNMFGG